MNFENLKGEKWKPVIVRGVVTKYQVSNQGRLQRSGSLLKSSSEGNKYIACALRVNGRYHKDRLHRLVAIAFKPNPKNLPQVNHKDGKKNNNHVSNLEWCTSKHNIRHSFATGLCVRPKGIESHLFNKGCLIFDPRTGKEYPSVATASRELGIPRTTISAEINGYRPIKYGFKKLLPRYY